MFKIAQLGETGFYLGGEFFDTLLLVGKTEDGHDVVTKFPLAEFIQFVWEQLLPQMPAAHVPSAKRLLQARGYEVRKRPRWKDLLGV
jgi:hypothetical protein